MCREFSDAKETGRPISKAPFTGYVGYYVFAENSLYDDYNDDDEFYRTGRA
jgi:hypothetical protein